MSLFLTSSENRSRWLYTERSLYCNFVGSNYVAGVLHAKPESTGVQTMARISQNVLRSVPVSVSYRFHRGKHTFLLC